MLLLTEEDWVTRFYHEVAPTALADTSAPVRLGLSQRDKIIQPGVADGIGSAGHPSRAATGPPDTAALRRMRSTLQGSRFQNLVAAEVTRLKYPEEQSLLTSAATVLKEPQRVGCYSRDWTQGSLANSATRGLMDGIRWDKKPRRTMGAP